MTLIFMDRPSDSPYIDSVIQGHTTASGQTIRPAELRWHMVFTRIAGQTFHYVVGPWATAGEVQFAAGAEILWLRFRLGAFLSHLPTRKIVASETLLPGTAGGGFWLQGSTWEMPDFENADTFAARLARQNVLAQDALVSAALRDDPVTSVSPRTLRHRFLHATGLTRNHIRQVERAQRAARLLQEGMSILDTVYEAGYFDQPHLTRALRQFVGYTPAQIVHMSRRACESAATDSAIDAAQSVVRG